MNERDNHEWKLDLARRRARRLGFRGHDLDDAVQEIIVAVLEFEYDPALSNGASQSTVLTAVIDRQLKGLLRAKRRRDRRQEVVLEELGRARGTSTNGDVDEPFLGEDVAQAVEQLPAHLQAICSGLANGESMTALAQRLGYNWYTLQRHVDEIREHFQKHGMDGWLR